MDFNYGVHNAMNPPGTTNQSVPLANPAGTSLWIGNYPSNTEMQHINSQMGNIQLTDTGTNYLDSMLTNQHNVNNGYSLAPGGQTGQYFVTNVHESQPVNGNIPNYISTNNYNPWQMNNSIQTPPAAAVPAPLGMPTSPIDIQQKIFETQQQIMLLEQMKQQNAMAVSATHVPSADVNQGVVYQQIGAEEVNPPTILLRQPQPRTKAPPTTVIHQRSISAPVTPRAVRMVHTSASAAPETQTQRVSFTSETSSIASSTSTPGSPTSSGAPELSVYPGSSDDGDSPRYRSMNSPQNAGKRNVPTRSHSLKYAVKFPQDKCYKCMKKVYKMESIGPVKGAVYHKLCFTCKVCSTRLTLNNYTVNQSDSYDASVYCKSHTPEGAKGAKLDANSVLIKGCMSVPKLDKINDQIKVRDGKHHVDTKSMSIMHAQNVPAQNLQTGSKLKHNTWRIKNRKGEAVPGANVIRHSDHISDYDVQALDDFDKVLVEFDPDY